MQNLEIEYKVMIAKEDFYTLLNKLGETSFHKIEQTNFYFDTYNQDLKKNKLSLRIRKIENRYLMTLKQSLQEGKMEYEYEIPSCNLAFIPQEIQTILEPYVQVCQLHLLGSLTTIRYEKEYASGLLCLDHSFYRGKEDYEIEFEADNMAYAKHIVETLCKTNHISFEKSKYSKNARALK